MRIDFLGLQAFLSIAERGSFQRAAQHLNVTQTALSHRIRKLEDELGVQLLVRTTRKVSLTRAGLDLLPKASMAVADLAASLDDVRQQGRRAEKIVQIACLATIAGRYLPTILAGFRARHPQVQLKIFDGSATQVRELVQAGKAEFGLTVAGADSWDLDITTLARDDFALVCPRTDPLAAHTMLHWRALEGLPMIRVSPPTGSWALLDEALRGQTEKLNWLYDVQQVHTALGLVRAGAGYAVLPERSVDLAIWPDLAIRGLHQPEVMRTLCLVTKRGVPLSRAADDIRRALTAAIVNTAATGSQNEGSTL